MPYKTNYKLGVAPPSLDVVERIMEICPCDRGCWEDVSETGATLTCESWNDHQTDLLELSIENPLNIITLEGNGDDKGDRWKSYYYNGKVETSLPEITFPVPSWANMALKEIQERIEVIHAAEAEAERLQDFATMKRLLEKYYAPSKTPIDKIAILNEDYTKTNL